MKSQITTGLALSRNFQNVKLEMEDLVEYENESELKAHVRQRFNLIKSEMELEFTKLQ